MVRSRRDVATSTRGVGQLPARILAAVALVLVAAFPAAAQVPSADPAASPAAPGMGVSTPARPAVEAPAAPEPTTPAAVPVMVPSAGFGVSLPADWRVLEFGDDPVAALAAFALEHPELEELVRALAASGPMAVIAVAPPRDGDAVPATFSAFRGANMGLSAETMLDTTISMMPRMPGVGGEVTSEPMTIAGEEGFRVGYDWELVRGDGSVTPVRVEQYSIVTPDTILVFSVTDDERAPDAWRPVADSLVLLPED